MVLGVPTGQGEGPIGVMGPISQPRGTIDAVSLTPDRLLLPPEAFLETTLLWAAKGDLFPHEVEG